MNEYISVAKILSVPLDQLKPYGNNARTHSPRQISQIARSIKDFGFNNPILVDAGGAVIAGHGRLLAARELGLKEVPVISLEHLSDAEKRAYILADNKLAEKAGWDREILQIELEALFELDFDLTLTGFETPEIDLLLNVDGKELENTDTIPDQTAIEQRVSFQSH